MNILSWKLWSYLYLKKKYEITIQEHHYVGVIYIKKNASSILVKLRNLKSDKCWDSLYKKNY